MARNFVIGSGQYYTAPSLWANGAFTGTDNTCLARFRAATIATPNKSIIFMYDDTISNEFYMFLGIGAGSDSINALTRTTGFQTIQSFHHQNVTANVWHTAGYRRINNTLDTFYDGLIGTAPGTNESIGTYTSVNSQVIGSQGVGNYWDGDLADVAVWDVDLTQAEISAYHAGVSPTLIRPDKLVGYYPLWGGTIEAEYTGTGDVLTPVNAPTVSDSTFVASTYKKRTVPVQTSVVKRKEIEHIHRANLTAESQASATWRTILQIDKESLPANSRWLIYCIGSMSENSTTNFTFTQLTVGGVTLQGSLAIMRHKTATFTDARDYAYARVIDIGLTPEDIELQIKNTTTSTTRMRDSQIFMMRLDKDFIEGKDYWYRQNRARTPATTSFGNDTAYVTEIEHPLSELGTGNEYMVIGTQNHDSGVTLDDLRKIQITFNTGGWSQSMAEMFRHSTEERVNTQGALGVAQTVVADINFGANRTAVNNSGSENNHTFSSIFVIRKDLFEQTQFINETVDRLPTVAGTAESNINLDFTPNQVGSFMCLGFSQVKPEATSTAGLRNGRVQFKGGGSDLPIATSNWGCDLEGVNEQVSLNTMAYLQNLPASAYTLDLMVTSNEASKMNFQASNALVFSLLPAKHFKVSGFVKENGIPVSRTVRVMLSSTGEVLGYTTSRASDGWYEIEGLPGGNVSVVAYDDGAGDSFNTRIFDKVIPVTV